MEIEILTDPPAIKPDLITIPADTTHLDHGFHESPLVLFHGTCVLGHKFLCRRCCQKCLSLQFLALLWAGQIPFKLAANDGSVPKKKGRLVGLGRRTRSVPPSSAPPPFVDPEVLTAQLKDKDDRISLLETQMAAQQAGYEAQRRLNQQMMEMMQRMYPNEVFPDVPDP
ncbi:hypothetical protein F2Q69_00013303 [Brassica cretica]|uniref:Uncharacterized protein n=1 Tax=Brassica cretica TaxID=69181 RepID=A0A8S9QXV5_BRACR|nr:hypothetical protein F2Q69_00013303 [Brassica cretica]